MRWWMDWQARLLLMLRLAQYRSDSPSTGMDMQSSQKHQDRFPPIRLMTVDSVWSARQWSIHRWQLAGSQFPRMANLHTPPTLAADQFPVTGWMKTALWRCSIPQLDSQAQAAARLIWHSASTADICMHWALLLIPLPPSNWAPMEAWHPLAVSACQQVLSVWQLTNLK